MEERPTNCDLQWAAQIHALERMIELANRLEKIVDQLVEITEDDDPCEETSP